MTGGRQGPELDRTVPPAGLLAGVSVITSYSIHYTKLYEVTAFSAVAATLNNLGPGLGEVAAGFMTVPDPAKWIAIAGMLLGRLEIFTLLVLVTPTFWRH